jgi:ApbE superfamily uncharacterized protein (UPF0280 family)
MSAVAALLPDGRLHLQHGPIDCLCQAWGSPEEIRAAYQQAAAFFRSILAELCSELPLLRQPMPARRPNGAIAQAMHAACTPFATQFITPMAAVAGAVSDAVLAAMCHGRALRKAFVNNGGDIAFHLAPGMSLRCGLVTDLTAPGRSRDAEGASTNPDLSLRVAHQPAPDPPWMKSVTARNKATLRSGGVFLSGATAARQSGSIRRQIAAPRSLPAMTAEPGTPFVDDSENGWTAPPSLDGTFLLTAAHPARGIATSGRACKGQGGRSFSFGIADSVSVLARTAAQADAAATIIGNAVDLPGHPAIDRRPASAIDPDSDLGDRLITFDVGILSDETVSAALDAGATMADNLLQAGLIEGAVLALCGHMHVCHSSLAPQEVA